jgi:hypothetical protein
MAKRVNLDAMIPREDFGLTDVDQSIDLIKDFPLTNLESESPIRRLLRKPDFQRETYHWTPEQVVTFIASFVDSEVIPSLILWKSPSFIFVIDGGHRLSALRAWVEDDYGDGAISQQFYHGEITEDQKKIAKRTRQLIEEKIGRYSALKALVGQKLVDDPVKAKRAGQMFTRTMALQWVLGTQEVAETSFFKINSQGTPLDAIEELLIKSRKKPIAISARAILRAGYGHKYWSKFAADKQAAIETTAADLFKILFRPEIDSPLKTLDVPVGGSVSPVEALSLLIEFLTVTGSKSQAKITTIDDYPDDDTGDETIAMLNRSLEISGRITGNGPGSLGLHPAVYFYNEKGKHNRFLLLGLVALVAEKIRNNDGGWFKKFTKVRAVVEKFLVADKSVISVLPSNLSRAQRIPKMRDMFAFLVTEADKGVALTPESLIAHLGLTGRFIDVRSIQTTPHVNDDAKSEAFIQKAIGSALTCPICAGLLDTGKSISYDHAKRVREGGTGDVTNVQLSHPYCNTGYKN